MTQNYRVTLRDATRPGSVDFIRDLRADNECHAIGQCWWQLQAEHPDDWQSYRFQACVWIERKPGQEAGHSVPGVSFTPDTDIVADTTEAI